MERSWRTRPAKAWRCGTACPCRSPLDKAGAIGFRPCGAPSQAWPSAGPTPRGTTCPNKRRAPTSSLRPLAQAWPSAGPTPPGTTCAPAACSGVWRGASRPPASRWQTSGWRTARCWPRWVWLNVEVCGVPERMWVGVRVAAGEWMEDSVVLAGVGVGSNWSMWVNSGTG